MSLFLALIYVFRQGAVFFSEQYGTTLAGNLYPFYIIAVIYFFQIFKDKKKIGKIFLATAGMILYLGVQCLFIDNILILKAIVSITKITICIMILLYAKNNYKKIDLKKTAIYISYIFGIVVFFALIFKDSFLWRHNDYINKYDTVRLQLFYLEPSELGFHIIIVFIFLLYFFMVSKNRKEKIKLSICIAINLLTLFFARPMGAICIGAVAVGSMIIFDWIHNFSKKKTLVYLGLMISAIVFVAILFVTKSSITLRIIDTLNGTDSSNWYRINVSYNVMVESLKNTHLIGVGSGNLNSDTFRATYYYLGFYQVLANSFIYYIVENGIFGITALTLLLFILIRGCVKRPSVLKIGLLVFLVLYQILASHFTNGLTWFLYGLIISSYSFFDIKESLQGKINLTFLHAGAELYGADKVMFDLIHGLDKEKYKINVILPCEGPLVEKLRNDKIRVDIINYPILRRKYFSAKGIIKYILGYFYYSAKLIIRINKDKTDILHVNTSAVLEGIMIKSFCNIKLVWHIHEIIVNPPKMAKIIYSLVQLWSDQIVVVSEAVLKAVKSVKINNQNISVIYNGIDSSAFQENEKDITLMKQFNIENSDMVIGMIGRVNSWKGQEDFVEAVRPLVSDDPGVKALMVGGVFEGEEWRMERLVNLIAELDLTKKVIISDFRRDVEKVYNLIDIFVLPSTNPDPLPTVILEAMACGIPIVAYRHGGVCEMTQNGVNSLLVDVGDKNALSRAINVLLKNQGKRKEFAENSKNRQMSQFSLESYICNFDILYTTVFGRQ